MPGNNNNEDVFEIVRRLQAEINQMRANPQQTATIGSSDTPHSFYSDRAAICPARPNGQGNEVTPPMIALVKQNRFHGLETENPMDHIDDYERMCNTITNGNPSDYSMCMLFPFSLADKAEKWLKSLPPASLRTWKEIRAAFLDHFFTKAKTMALKNRITSFQQLTGESFCEAWERFKEYKMECPHHGYTDNQMLRLFYDGVNWDYKIALNSASNGDFMTQTKEGAYKLIDNLAASSYNRGLDYGRKQVNNVEAQRMEELQRMFDLMLKCNQKHVSFAGIGNVQDEKEQGEEDVNFVGGNFGQKFPYNNKPYKNSNSYSEPYSHPNSYSKPNTNVGRSYGSNTYQAPKP